ncbi:hypothetical protein BMS3Abin16_00121 [archaeon BMS3Abin16]|nr:hypothetical protein BMS3Abin16_00121 [archaeon BMS3Abin16]
MADIIRIRDFPDIIRFELEDWTAHGLQTYGDTVP